MKQFIEKVNSILKEEYEKTFQKWIERMKQCFFEHSDFSLSKIKISD